MENVNNPYQAPEADLDVPLEQKDLQFTDPQKKSAGQGWQWIKSAFSLFKASPGGWILTCLLGFIIMIAINIIPLIGSIFMMLTTYVWGAGLVYGSQQVDKGEKFKVSYLFSGFKLAAGKLILLSLLLSIISSVIMVASIGPVYLDLMMGNENPEAFANIDPQQFLLSGLIATAFYIPMMMAVWFAPALIIFHKTSIFNALKLSFIGCLKNIIPFFIYSLIMIILMFLAMIPVGLGFLILMPVMFASLYTSYKAIFLKSA
ncbi:BPSS1780 family membrane protein [Gayadomonas joobiniege]|uniref:BPSS1780 family membrane protein n=1 Tax=Gayadomonas joobiniege TaxID=1234606 RepID=UPI00037D484C|nr:BPSS1780 family membrane protein [Gayadomonas joobiniege]